MVMYKHAFSKSSKWILSINGSYFYAAGRNGILYLLVP